MAQGRKKVALALQGGASHGAFTWGVVDRLLQDGRIDIEGISGTSAGAMNAAAIAQGFIKGGEEGARAELRRYWQAVSSLGSTSPFQPSLIDLMIGKHGVAHNPGTIFMNMLGQMFSPKQLNPLGINPFKYFLEGFFDCKKLSESDKIKLFLCATNARTTKLKIFENKEITPDAMLASACLPLMFEAVEINGEHYWDGGYIGNPAIYPLINKCDSQDIIVVLLSPVHIDQVPETKEQITARLNRITFISTMVREMRMIDFVTDLIDQGAIKSNKLKRVNMHIIQNEDFFLGLDESSHYNTQWYFLEHLYQEGVRTAERWIKENFDDIGRRSTADLQELFE
jgi:NTE family protein